MNLQHTLIQRLAVYAAVCAIFAAALVVVFSGTWNKAHANPSYFDRSSGTNGPATTTPNFMTAGTATTTETFDTGHGRGGSQALDSAVLQLGIRSSTTVATLYGTTTVSVRIEQSDNGIDWSFATSTLIQTGIEQTGLGALVPAAMTMRTIPLPTPLRFIRAIIGVAAGSSNNAGVWAQFVGKRENN